MLQQVGALLEDQPVVVRAAVGGERGDLRGTRERGAAVGIGCLLHGVFLFFRRGGFLSRAGIGAGERQEDGEKGEAAGHRSVLFGSERRCTARKGSR